MLKNKKRKLILAISLTLLSAVLLSTASYAWFAMNTKTNADNFKVEAYSDSRFLQISNDDGAGKTHATRTWAASVSHENTAPKDLRLATYKTIAVGNTVYKAPTFTAVATDTYYTANNATAYYQRADSDATSTDGIVSGNAYNYIQVDPAEFEPATDLTQYYTNITFKSAISEEGDPTVYFKKVNNDYIKATDEEIESMGKELFVLYQGGNLVADGAPTAAAGIYQTGNSNVYWKKSANGDFSGVEDLTVGTNLKGYYTVGASSATVTVDAESKFEADTLYYVTNTNGSLTDYVCIGKPGADVLMSGYIYWGRAYSSSLTEAQGTNTLNVMSSAVAAADYYLYDTLYIRQGENTNHADNLKVSAVKVEGATNSMTDALRVLLVAASTSGEKATAVYDAGTKTITHKDEAGQNADKLFARLLGDEQEVITVEVYIFFDGTDAVAKNESLGVLNGQTVSIQFSIDELNYNEVN